MNLPRLAPGIGLLCLLISAVPAQNSPKPVTNSDISKMIAAGLPESSTIVQEIYEGRSAFDTIGKS